MSGGLWTHRVSASRGGGFDLDGIAVRFARRDPETGVREALTEDGWASLERGQYTEPLLFLDEPLAQALMEDLWREGVRPKSWGYEGEVSALKEHLSDMRKIVQREADLRERREARLEFEGRARDAAEYERLRIQHEGGQA